jgi:hypothetical protein
MSVSHLNDTELLQEVERRINHGTSTIKSWWIKNLQNIEHCSPSPAPVCSPIQTLLQSYAFGFLNRIYSMWPITTLNEAVSVLEKRHGPLPSDTNARPFLMEVLKHGSSKEIAHIQKTISIVLELKHLSLPFYLSSDDGCTKMLVHNMKPIYTLASHSWGWESCPDSTLWTGLVDFTNGASVHVDIRLTNFRAETLFRYVYIVMDQIHRTIYYLSLDNRLFKLTYEGYRSHQPSLVDAERVESSSLPPCPISPDRLTVRDPHNLVFGEMLDHTIERSNILDIVHKYNVPLNLRMDGMKLVQYSTADRQWLTLFGSEFVRSNQPRGCMVKGKVQTSKHVPDSTSSRTDLHAGLAFCSKYGEWLAFYGCDYVVSYQNLKVEVCNEITIAMRFHDVSLKLLYKNEELIDVVQLESLEGLITRDHVISPSAGLVLNDGAQLLAQTDLTEIIANATRRPAHSDDLEVPETLSVDSDYEHILVKREIPCMIEEVSADGRYRQWTWFWQDLQHMELRTNIVGHFRSKVNGDIDLNVEFHYTFDTKHYMLRYRSARQKDTVVVNISICVDHDKWYDLVYEKDTHPCVLKLVECQSNYVRPNLKDVRTLSYSDLSYVDDAGILDAQKQAVVDETVRRSLDLRLLDDPTTEERLQLTWYTESMQVLLTAIAIWSGQDPERQSEQNAYTPPPVELLVGISKSRQLFRELDKYGVLVPPACHLHSVPNNDNVLVRSLTVHGVPIWTLCGVSPDERSQRIDDSYWYVNNVENVRYGIRIYTPFGVAGHWIELVYADGYLTQYRKVDKKLLMSPSSVNLLEHARNMKLWRMERTLRRWPFHCVLIFGDILLKMQKESFTGLDATVLSDYKVMFELLRQISKQAPIDLLDWTQVTRGLLTSHHKNVVNDIPIYLDRTWTSNHLSIEKDAYGYPMWTLSANPECKYTEEVDEKETDRYGEKLVDCIVNCMVNGCKYEVVYVNEVMSEVRTVYM